MQLTTHIAVPYAVYGHTLGFDPQEEAQGPIFADTIARCCEEEEMTAGIWPNGHVFIQGPHLSRPVVFYSGYCSNRGGRGRGEGWLVCKDHHTVIVFNIADFTLQKTNTIKKCL